MRVVSTYFWLAVVWAALGMWADDVRAIYIALVFAALGVFDRVREHLL